MSVDQFDLSLWRGQVSEKSDDSSDAEEIPCLEQVPSSCTGSENDVAIPPCANDEEVVPVMPKPSSAKCSGEAQQSEPSGRGVNVEGKSSKESKALDVEVREQTLKQSQAARRAVDTKPLDAVQRGRADEKGRKKKVESASEPSHSRAARKMRPKKLKAPLLEKESLSISLRAAVERRCSMLNRAGQGLSNLSQKSAVLTLNRPMLFSAGELSRKRAKRNLTLLLLENETSVISTPCRRRAMLNPAEKSPRNNAGKGSSVLLLRSERAKMAARSMQSKACRKSFS